MNIKSPTIIQNEKKINKYEEREREQVEWATCKCTQLQNTHYSHITRHIYDNEYKQQNNKRLDSVHAL